MATERKSKTPRIALTTFYGGKGNGASLLVSYRQKFLGNIRPSDLSDRSISLTREEARTLSEDLKTFADGGHDALEAIYD